VLTVVYSSLHFNPVSRWWCMVTSYPS